jgi:hypothetical protein
MKEKENENLSTASQHLRELLKVLPQVKEKFQNFRNDIKL